MGKPHRTPQPVAQPYAVSKIVLVVVVVIVIHSLWPEAETQAARATALTPNWIAFERDYGEKPRTTTRTIGRLERA
jgi:hypothetical protein